jgi:purine-cytosine permease-like protein
MGIINGIDSCCGSFFITGVLGVVLVLAFLCNPANWFPIIVFIVTVLIGLTIIGHFESKKSTTPPTTPAPRDSRVIEMR